MTPTAIPAPGSDEYAPFYAGYVAAVKDTDVVSVLERQGAQLRAACARLSDDDAMARYASGKWSIKEVLGHVTDAERIFGYRLLRLARADTTPIEGFDENAYVAAADFDRQQFGELLADFDAVRAASLRLVRGLGPEVWERRGVVNGRAVSVRALVYIMAGHVQHHMRVLDERYGVGAAAAGAGASRVRDYSQGAS
jgi:uncharacterized damage-inducible protein DinB